MDLQKGRFEVCTNLDLPFELVRQNFNQKLFEELTKGFPPIYLTRFDGVFNGAETHLRLFSPWGPRWVSVITSFHDHPDELKFTDKGTKLPPGLCFWNHTHHIKRTPLGTQIIDAIELSGCPSMLTPILSIIFRENMKSRGKVYKSYLNSVAAQQSHAAPH